MSHGTKLGCLLLLVLFIINAPLLAHEGHDHGDEKKALPNLGNTPQRQADGVVFLPKSAQRQMGIRTLAVVAEDSPITVELSGKVVMDPNRGGRVQTMISGRVESATASGLPVGGQSVRKGDILAWVVAASGQIERAGQSAQLAELQARQSLATKRLSRLQSLADTVPARDIEAAESDLAALAGQIKAIRAGLNGREALVAPVSGVIASSSVVVGQVVDARDLVFEIIAPDRLTVEALAYDIIDLDALRGATLAVGNGSLSMSLMGNSRRLREQALPLLFSHEGQGAGLTLPLGQPVKIQVQLRSTVSGMAIPQQALSRSAANESIVWVKIGPERFMPRSVLIKPLDGSRVVVTRGLDTGDRVVVEGASLIAQVR
jgi:membrane fusion protein, heavy metal efflux system